MTQIVDFSGALQAPTLYPHREWMVENQRVVLEEDSTINQAQQFAPNIGKVNQGKPCRVE